MIYRCIGKLDDNTYCQKISDKPSVAANPQWGFLCDDCASDRRGKHTFTASRAISASIPELARHELPLDQGMTILDKSPAFGYYHNDGVEE